MILYKGFEPRKVLALRTQATAPAVTRAATRGVTPAVTRIQGDTHR